MPEVNGTLASHTIPITTPNPRATTGVAGSSTKPANASARVLYMMLSSRLFANRMPSAPAANAPTMLNRPTSDHDKLATAVSRPASVSVLGRCTPMNVTWKPQTKNVQFTSK